jgi:hypothetical protein
VNYPRGGAVKLVPSLETDGYPTLAAKIDEFLDARPPGSFCNQEAVDGPAGTQCLPDWMNSGEYRH